MGTIIDNEPTPCNQVSHALMLILNMPTYHSSDETAAEDRVVSTPTRSSRQLNDDAENEDACVNHDGVFAAEDFGQKTRVDCADPSPELEDTGEPTLLVWINDPWAHVVSK